MKMLRFFLYSFLFLAIVILAYFYVVPTGKINYKQDFSKNYYNILGAKGFFHKFGPVDRLFGENKIIGDPVYFYLKTSRTFSKAKLKIKFRLSPELIAENNYLNIEAGVLVDKENWHYDLKPIFNSTLNQVLLDDNFVAKIEDDIIFAQKKSAIQFLSYKDFLQNNNYSKSLFFNYYPAYDFKIVDYFFQDRVTTNGVTTNGVTTSGLFTYDIITNLKNLRGSHTFYTYIKNDDLKIDFKFALKEIINDQTAESLVNIFVYYQDKTIFSDDFSVIKGKIKDYELNLPNLPEGAYKVEIKTSDNVIIKELETNLNKLSFLNHVWLDKKVAGFSLYSNKNNFKIKSVDSNCLGIVKSGQESIDINKIYQQFNFSLSPDNLNTKETLNKIESNSCGLLIENNGLFSFSEVSFINPLLNKLDQESKLSDYDYILATSQKISLNNEIYESEVDFDLSKASRDKDGYRFLISTPFLQDLNKDKYLEVMEIEVELEGRTLFAKIASLFNKEK